MNRSEDGFQPKTVLASSSVSRWSFIAASPQLVADLARN